MDMCYPLVFNSNYRTHSESAYLRQDRPFSTHSRSIVHSGVGVRLKVGINIEKSEGVGPREGLCPPSWESGACPHKKKINFALKIMQF